MERLNQSPPRKLPSQNTCELEMVAISINKLTDHARVRGCMLLITNNCATQNFESVRREISVRVCIEFGHVALSDVHRPEVAPVELHKGPILVIKLAQLLVLLVLKPHRRTQHVG